MIVTREERLLVTLHAGEREALLTDGALVTSDGDRMRIERTHPGRGQSARFVLVLECFSGQRWISIEHAILEALLKDVRYQMMFFPAATTACEVAA